MSIKMSEAVVDVDVVDVEENVSSEQTAKKENFKVITATNIENPFTFEDEEVVEGRVTTHKDCVQAIMLTISVLVAFFITTLVQSAIHTTKVEALINASEIEKIVVMPGDTLWDIASRSVHGKMNVSEFIYYISEMNGLSNATLVSGQVIEVPSL